MEFHEITIEKVFQTFELLPSWEDRFRYVIDLGRKLPPLPDELHVDENLVEGCMSKVWLVIQEQEGDQGVQFLADSDAHIVKGLVAILLIIYSRKTPQEIQEVDLEGIFKRLDLENHLSVNRRNGFFSMVEKIRSLAKTKSST